MLRILRQIETLCQISIRRCITHLHASATTSHLLQHQLHFWLDIRRPIRGNRLDQIFEFVYMGGARLLWEHEIFFGRGWVCGSFSEESGLWRRWDLILLLHRKRCHESCVLAYGTLDLKVLVNILDKNNVLAWGECLCLHLGIYSGRFLTTWVFSLELIKRLKYLFRLL